MTASGCPKPAMRSVEVANNHGVPLHIRSAFTWETGTLVVDTENKMEQIIIRAVTHDMSESKVKVSKVPDKPGLAGSLFRVLANGSIDVDMIVQNTSDDGVTDISFTVPTDQLESATGILEEGTIAELGAESISVDDSIGRVSVIGAGMKSNPGVAATMFEVLAANGINIEMISTSAIRISCVIAADRCEEAVQLLHTAFDLDA